MSLVLNGQQVNATITIILMHYANTYDHDKRYFKPIEFDGF